MTRPVRLFSIVFNEPYLTWFEQGCVPSLLWPKNFTALRDAVAWDVWTCKQDAPRVLAAARRMQIPVELSSSIPHHVVWEDKEPLKQELLRALLSEIALCADRQEAFLWIAPDSIFGDGSVRSIREVGKPKDVCVALAPMRVRSEGFVEAMGAAPLSNAALVRLAFERMHPAFAAADADHPFTNTFVSGVSWRAIGPGLYAVTHLKHSAYLMQPTISDGKWFKSMNKFGAYDHSFPMKLVMEQRQRVIGSSDAAFVAELTPETAHCPKPKPASPDEPDRYQHEHPHHAANRNVVAIWRAA